MEFKGILRNNLFIILFLIIIGVQFAIGQPKPTFIGKPILYFGASYYPEAWPKEDIELDIKRMKELHMNVVRMAEFSWSSMEPKEGNYKFEWLHEIIEKLHDNGISVILGTPTATPPAWLTEKYPEILRTNEDGTKEQHGARKSYNFSCKIYQQKMAEFVERMAKEFGKTPGVIAWQTDNEFSLQPDYGSETKQVWHEWLKQKYGTIDNLNKKWNTVLWSQQYNSFGQIPMPAESVWHNPSLRWCWQDFTSDQVVKFQDIQLKEIRKHSSLPITHDCTPGNKLNFEKLFADLDFMAVNNYHSFEAYSRIISNYDRMRGYGKGYYWLFETAPNNSGGGEKGQTWFIHQPVGSLKAAIWMNFALGGQGSMFWPWRQHWGGHEMVHGAVISAWNKPAANYNEIKTLGEELSKCSKFLMSAPVEPAQIGVLYSHEAIMAFNIENYVNDIHYYNDWTYRFYLPVQRTHLHRDVIGFNTNLEQYKIVFLPMCPYVPDHFRQKLKEWVEKGGTLIVGPLSGYRNEDFTGFINHANGDWGYWMNVQVESRVPIGLQRRPAEEPFHLKWVDEIEIQPAEASLWSEALSVQGGKVLAKYTSGVHQNLPAIVEAKVKKGKVIYLGTDPGQKAVSTLFLSYAKEAGIYPRAEGGEGTIIVPRKGEKSKGYVILNITGEAKNITLDIEKSTNIITGKMEGKQIELKPFETKVLEIK